MADEELQNNSTTSRHVKAVQQDNMPSLLPTYEKSWAVIVGINSYLHFNRLDNAVKDALGMGEVLVTRLDFPCENVFLALDPLPEDSVMSYFLASNLRPATKVDIEDLLLNVLCEKAGENDRVLVFYAGHGDQRPVPGERERSWAFLIPVDALPGKWNTYIDWEMVRRAGDDFCRAKHIFYVLDACYSGIVNTRDASVPPRDVRDALTNRARQALAAGTNRQVVADVGKEGHSPFTWHLIQGLRGDAAPSGHGGEGSVISAHDLIGYVRRSVAEESSTEQTPSGGSIAGHGGGDFIFRSPLIGFSSQEHLELGVGLMNLGLQTGERTCFESATRNLREALKLRQLISQDMEGVEEWLGRALLLTDSDDAMPTLESAAADGSATAQLYLGLEYAKRGRVDEAARSLESFVKNHPDHADSAWASAYAHRLRETGGKRKYALLVGVDKQAYIESPLMGCVNDVFLVKSLLEEVYGFDPAGIKVLTDEQATASNIIAGLEHLASVALPQDTVVFLFSGHGTQIPAMGTTISEDGKWFVLCPYDMTWEHKDIKNAITEPQLHELMTKIPARDKLVLAGAAHACPARDTTVSEDGYRFFSACQRDQFDAETLIEGKYYGAFIYHLCESARKLVKDENAATAGNIAQGVCRGLKDSEYWQDPQYYGNADKPLLPWLPRGPQPEFIALHEFGNFREYSSLDSAHLEAWQARLEMLADIPHSRGWLSCGRAWLRHEQFARAVSCGRRAIEQPGCDQVEARLLLCEAHIKAYEFEFALQQARNLRKLLSADNCDDLIQASEHLAQPHRRALLVAIQKYPKSIGVNLQGPFADAQALKSILVNRCGFRDADVEVLTNEDASREKILEKFSDLARYARTHPALFYFGGLGADIEYLPAICVPSVRQLDIWPSSAPEIANHPL